MIRFLSFLSFLSILSILSLSVSAETVVSRAFVVQISEDGSSTIPPNSIATPTQVSTLSQSAEAAKTTAETLQATADAAAATASAASERAYLFSSNYVVTSTVYVQSIGGVPYDASNQLIRCHSLSLTPTSVVIVATVKQQPLATPVLDWRQSLDGGAWSNVSASVVAADIPAGVTNAVAAYRFELLRSPATSAYFRVVDNSTGASGSGLYWLVYGGIYVDGRKGKYCTITNVVGSVTNRYNIKGGIVVEPDPL